MSKVKPLTLITGATSGIGKVLAHLLAEKGYPLLLTGRQTQEGIYPFDLRDRKGLIALIREKKPQILINNAGYGLYGQAVDLPLDKQLEMVEVNVKAVLELTLEAAKVMQPGGIILNVSSAASFQHIPGMATYVASKAFVTSWSQTLDLELQEKGIRVLTACPGQVDTQFYARAGGNPNFKRKMVLSPEKVAEEILTQIENKQSLKIIDWKYKLLTWVSRLFPGIALKIMKKDLKSRGA